MTSSTETHEETRWQSTVQEFIHGAILTDTVIQGNADPDDLEYGSSIAFAIDTSRAYRPGVVEQVWDAVRESAVNSPQNPRSIVIVQCDSDIRTAQERRLVEYILQERPNAVTHLTGRAGTLYTPVFKYLRPFNVSCVVYVTDLVCPIFGRDPGYPVLWAVVDPAFGGAFNPPPYGETLLIPSGECQSGWLCIKNAIGSKILGCAPKIPNRLQKSLVCLPSRTGTGGFFV